jgi:DNA-binding NarL/FixJ family response regulator
VIVVEGPDETFARAVAEVGSSGWRVVGGFAGDPGSGGRAPSVVRTGSVASAEDAAAALLAALGGSGLVVHARATREVIDRLLGDLRHVGPVQHRVGNDVPTPPALDADALAILGRLARGQTLGEAASDLGLSRRTADRRLAGARRALGAERTVEAVSKARRLGWLG